ncbi:calcium/sodium antiporter [Patescibacteria group bacterium]
MVFALIFSLLCFSAILIKAADFVIVALRRISRKTKTGVFALSAVILALGTSFPEMFVGITSALEGAPELAFGVVIGSNIANISLVVGVSALIAGKVNVHGEFLKRDVWIALVTGLLPILLVLDGSLGRVDGLILLAIYGAYASSFFRKRYDQIAKENEKESFFYRFMRRFNHIDGKITVEFGRLFLGIALLLFSADMIVRIAQILAVTANIPVFVVGLVVLAIGTSLPEIVFSFRSLEGHHPSMFFGNILGSTIANSTLIIGITSLIDPITVPSVDNYFIASITFIVVSLTFWYFIKTKLRLDRWEAAVLVLLYCIFVIVQFV